MSKDDVNTEILTPMQATFLSPKMDEEAQKAALMQYIVVLEGFDATDLRAAWQEVLTAHTGRSWPVPGVIVLAARKARRDRTGETGLGQYQATRSSKEFSARKFNWHKLRQSPEAQLAAEEGWANLLYADVMDGKVVVPGDVDVVGYRRESDRLRENEERVRVGDNIILADGKTARIAASFVRTYLNGRKEALIREGHIANSIKGYAASSPEMAESEPHYRPGKD